MFVLRLFRIALELPCGLEVYQAIEDIPCVRGIPRASQRYTLLVISGRYRWARLANGAVSRVIQARWPE